MAPNWRYNLSSSIYLWRRKQVLWNNPNSNSPFRATYVLMKQLCQYMNSCQCTPKRVFRDLSLLYKSILLISFIFPSAFSPAAIRLPQAAASSALLPVGSSNSRLAPRPQITDFKSCSSFRFFNNPWLARPEMKEKEEQNLSPPS